MAKEFDIYLRKHSVEGDVFVYSIPYRDGLSMVSRLILEAVLDDCFLRQYISAQTEFEIDANVDDLTKMFPEELDIKMELSTTPKLSVEVKKKLILDDSPITINVPPVETIERTMNRVDNSLVLSVNQVSAQMISSAGVIHLPIEMGANVIGTLKESSLNLQPDMVLASVVEHINQVDLINASVFTIVDSILNDLFYKQIFDADADIEIAALVLGTELLHSLGSWYNGLSITSHIGGEWAKKFLTVQTGIGVMQNAIWKLIKVLYPDSNVMRINIPDVNAHVKRYRLLNEIDDLSLADIDDMTLEELDFVYLT